MARGIGRALQKAVAREGLDVDLDAEGRSLANARRRQVYRYLCLRPCARIGDVGRDLSMSQATARWHARDLLENRGHAIARWPGTSTNPVPRPRSSRTDAGIDIDRLGAVVRSRGFALPHLSRHPGLRGRPPSARRVRSRGPCHAPWYSCKIKSRTSSGFSPRKSASVSPSRDLSRASRTFFGIDRVKSNCRSWDGVFTVAGRPPSTPWITIPSPRTIWNGWDTGLWRLFRHFTIFRRRDGSASLLLSFRWTTQSARYIGITVSGPARSACPCSSSVQRTVPTFRVCLNM